MEHSCSGLLLIDVVLPLPLAETYTYRLPESMHDRVRVGSRVIVPFGNKKIYSVIVVKGPYPQFPPEEGTYICSQLMYYIHYTNYEICKGAYGLVRNYSPTPLGEVSGWGCSFIIPSIIFLSFDRRGILCWPPSLP